MDVRVLAAALLGLSVNAIAGTNGFTALGPTGGAVTQITISPDGNAAFMVTPSGFYRSPDAGVTWNVIKSDWQSGPWDLAVDPSDPNRLYTTSANAPCLWLSVDGGKSLTAATNLPAAITQVHHVAVSHDGATIYLASFGRIFSSVDRGQNWQERTAISTDTTTTTTKLMVDPGDATTLYAAAYTASDETAAVYITRNGGSTWQQLTSGPEETGLTNDLAINPANTQQIWSARYDGIWVSADRGAHWSNLLSTAMYAVAVDPSNPLTLYAGSSAGRIYRSTNGGSNWTEVTGNITAGENPRLVVNPAHPAQLLVGGLSGVSGSANSASTWNPQQTGFVATNISTLSADPAADRIYIHAPLNGIFFSAAGGAAQPVNNAALLARSSMPSMFVTAFLGQQGRLFASLNTGLTWSADGGSTWAAPVDALPSLPGTQFIRSMSSAASMPQDIIAATYGPTLRRSTDRGATWSAAGNGLPTNAVASNLLVAPADAAIVYGAFFLDAGGPTRLVGLFKSLNAGVDWAPVNSDVPVSPTQLLAVDPTNADIAYGSNQDSPGVTQPSLLKTMDGGGHWTAEPWNDLQPGTAPAVLTVDPVHAYILYGAYGARIARSVDGGASWETLRDSSTPTWGATTMVADPNRPENLLVGTYTAGTRQITIAPDLKLDVVGPGAQVALGSQVTYTYTATNLGPFDATGVRATVHLPAAALSAAAVVSSGTGTCAVAGSVATCTYPILRKGASSTFTINTQVHAAGDFNVAASVSGEQPDADGSNNSADLVGTASLLSDLSVTATAPASATVGDAVSYTVTAANGGPNTAEAAQLTVQMAAGVTLGTVSSAGATCTTAAGQVSCNLGSLPASGSVTVTINATAATAGAQSSVATVTSSTSDPSSANNSATATTTVNAAAAPAPAATHGGGGRLSIYDVSMLLLLLAQGRRAGLGRGRRAPHARH